MKKFIEFEIDIFDGKEYFNYQKKMFPEEHKEDMDEIEQLIKSANGDIEENPVPPIPRVAKYGIQPEEIFSYEEAYSMMERYLHPDRPAFDRVIITFKNGAEQSVNCSLKQFKNKINRYYKQYSHIVEQSIAKTN